MTYVIKADGVRLLEEYGREIDLILTDVPYESLEKHRAKGTTTRLSHSKSSSNAWFDIFPNARFAEFFRAAERALVLNGSLYFFCDLDTAKIADPIAQSCGLVCRNWLVWNKKKRGMGYSWRRQKEFILFFCRPGKGNRRPLNFKGWGDVLTVPSLRGKGLYPTQKPVELAEKLILNSTDAGQLVVDPFCGSGAFGDAAVTHGRRFLGADTADAAVLLANARIMMALEARDAGGEMQI